MKGKPQKLKESKNIHNLRTENYNFINFFNFNSRSNKTILFSSIFSIWKGHYFKSEFYLVKISVKQVGWIHAFLYMWVHTQKEKYLRCTGSDQRLRPINAMGLIKEEQNMRPGKGSNPGDGWRKPRTRTLPQAQRVRVVLLINALEKPAHQ